MTSTFGAGVAAWLATYAIHSTLLIGAVALFVKLRAPNAAVRDFGWKLALTGALVTSTIQQGANLRPLGSLAFERKAAGAPASLAAPIVVKPSVKGVESAKSVAATQKSDAVTQPAAVGVSDVDAPDATPPVATLPDSETESPAQSAFTNYLVLAWGAVALLLALTYLARRLMLAGRLVTRRQVTEGRLHALLGTMRADVGFDGAVTLTAASTIASPVALGLSEICVPEVALTDLDEEQQRGLLAHELAHLARRDPLWLDAASLLERVFFFQPLNRYVRRELQQNAEYICDDWAAAHTGSGEPLARCLARVAEWIEASPLGVPVAGMAEQRSLLVTRISRLLEDTPVRFSISKVTMALATTAALIAVVIAVPAVHARAPQQATDTSDKRARESTDTKGRSEEAALAASSSRFGALRSVEAMSEARAEAKLAGRLQNEGRRAERDSEPEQDPAVVTALIERLSDSNASVRRAAAQSLGNLRARRAVSALIGVLGDKNREVRSAAASALGSLEDPKAIQPLIKLLSDESPEVREQAISSLSRFENEVPAAPMIAALGDTRPDIRARAADILGNIGDRAAIQPLGKLLKDPSADVRRGALQALARFSDASAGPAMLAALDDANADVRGAAIHALRESHIAIPEATTLKLLADNSREVRQQAVESLRDQPLAPALVSALTKLITDDPSGDVKESAVETLAEARNPAARDAIKGALNSPDARVRRAAAEALGNRP